MAIGCQVKHLRNGSKIVCGIHHPIVAIALAGQAMGITLGTIGKNQLRIPLAITNGWKFLPVLACGNGYISQPNTMVQIVNGVDHQILGLKAKMNSVQIALRIIMLMVNGMCTIRGHPTQGGFLIVVNNITCHTARPTLDSASEFNFLNNYKYNCYANI